MTINKIKNCLDNCLKLNCIFENEAQFRDSFVEELRRNYKNYDIKIEVHFDYVNKKYLCFDIVAKDNSTNDIKVIELKYHKNRYNQKNILGKLFKITNNFNYRKVSYIKEHYGGNNIVMSSESEKITKYG